MKTSTSKIAVSPITRACYCTGPQNGSPYCPCEMTRRGIFVRNGRWIEPQRSETDLGPAYSSGFLEKGNVERYK